MEGWLAEQVVDMPQGYRMTELGPLPEEWRVAKLGEVLEEVDERVSDCDDPMAKNLPVLSLTKNEGLILQTNRFNKRIATEDVSNYKIVRQGHIVYNPYVIWEGAIHILRKYKAGLVSPVYPVLKAKEKIADPCYLDAWLRTPSAIAAYNRFAAGAVNRRRAIRKRDFWRIQLPLPPLPEQRAIAHVLRTVQRAKEATERVIAALRELKKSLMKHLFTYGPVPVGATDQVALQDTPIGPLPAHWRVTKLGEVAEKPQYGYTTSAIHEPAGPKFLRITDIQNDRVHWASVPYCVIEEDLLAKYRLRKGDILFARIGATTGKTCLVRECPKAVFASYLIRVRTQADQLLPEYLYFFTHTSQYWHQINSAKGGRLKQGINIPILTTLRLPLPPLDEQREIARILQTVDDKIEAEESRKRALEVLFKTLLHHLMTAKICLPKDYIEQFKARESVEDEQE